MLDDTLVAFTPDKAARLAGLTRRQVDYWRKTLLLAPSTDQPVSAYRSIRLYDFSDMLSLMTVGELLRRDVTLQRVRKIVTSMQAIGYDRPLSQLRFGTVKPEGRQRPRFLVSIELADGMTVTDDDLGQTVLPEAIDIEEIKARIRNSTQRDQADVGKIERKRSTRGSREVFAGTRVPVATVRSYLSGGVSVDEILEAFPSLKRGDVDAARVPA